SSIFESIEDTPTLSDNEGMRRARNRACHVHKQRRSCVCKNVSDHEQHRRDAVDGAERVGTADDDTAAGSTAAAVVDGAFVANTAGDDPVVSDNTAVAAASHAAVDHDDATGYHDR